MTKQEKQDLMLIGGAMLAFGALCLLTGFIFGSEKKKTKMLVNEKGELEEQELEA